MTVYSVVYGLECPSCGKHRMERLEQSEIWGGPECFVAVECSCGFRRIVRDDFKSPITNWEESQR